MNTVTLARASLDSSKHTLVDLSALLAQHATELVVLERIYYINNNQHRAALFWQRVVEARRHARRLKSFDLSSLVDTLRRSFHDDKADVSSKPQKGAWSRYPPAAFLKSFLTRLHTCTMLTLAMRSGAFLHLVVTLTALVARLAHLSSAIRRVLSTLHAECLRLFDTLHHAEAAHKVTALRPPVPLLRSDNSASDLQVGITRPAVLDSDLDMSVDLGEAVVRAPTVTLEPEQPEPRSTSPLPSSFLTPPRRKTATDHALPALAPLPPSSTLKPSSSQAVIVKKRPAPPPLNALMAVEEKKQKKRAKVKKAPRDEIDDIFS
ncbi:hypothetical protein B0F90DRAFT_1689314 [Multifurca ochricompacta]|uniref:Nucleolus and neural progenitor protein-like N-terminal domain-containing protein n=1 Tax=Multifurca ochricompacta TaxID=376703 RepID=A0AAD4MC34_9AGAM|nr:hypothetical protein B0F90DRAFT_1689314 [Multifurca ochricompacta]